MNGAGRGFDLNKIDATAYDRLIFSFIGINGDEGPQVQTITRHGEAAPGYPEGHITLVDFWGDLASFRNVGVKSATSIWQMKYNNFKTYTQRNCQGLLGGLESNHALPDDGKNYVLLMGELRKALDKNFTKTKEITIAASAVKEKIANSHIPALIDAGLDNIYLMAYENGAVEL